MKNILKIFIDDVKRIRKNVIAMIVVIGVLVVPPTAWSHYCVELGSV